MPLKTPWLAHALTDAALGAATFDGVPYSPQASEPVGLVAAADQATYDLVQRLLPDLG